MDFEKSSIYDEEVYLDSSFSSESVEKVDYTEFGETDF